MDIISHDAFLRILDYALETDTLAAVAVVSQAWKATSNLRGCWNEKYVDVSRTTITDDVLKKWWPVWVDATVILRRSQLDVLDPLSVKSNAFLDHSMVFYGNDPARVWHIVPSLHATRNLAMTAEQAPPEATVVHERHPHGCGDFPVTFGWTSATCIDDLAHLLMEDQLSDESPFVDALVLTLHPRCAFGFRADVAVMYTSTDLQTRRDRQIWECFALVEDVCYDPQEWCIASLTFEPENCSLTIDAGDTEIAVTWERDAQPSVQPERSVLGPCPKRFFIGVPPVGRHLPLLAVVPTPACSA